MLTAENATNGLNENPSNPSPVNRKQQPSNSKGKFPRALVILGFILLTVVLGLFILQMLSGPQDKLALLLQMDCDELLRQPEVNYDERTGLIHVTNSDIQTLIAVKCRHNKYIFQTSDSNGGIFLFRLNPKRIYLLLKDEATKKYTRDGKEVFLIKIPIVLPKNTTSSELFTNSLLKHIFSTLNNKSEYEAFLQTNPTKDEIELFFEGYKKEFVEYFLIESVKAPINETDGYFWTEVTVLSTDWPEEKK